VKNNGKLIALAAVGLAMAPASARADIKHFLNYCSPGAMRACASIVVETSLRAGGGTNVSIRVRNLQGWGWYGDNTGGSSIRRVGLITPQIVGASGLSVSTIGTVGQQGSPNGYWFLDQPAGLGGLIQVASSTNYTGEGGIRGCDNPTYSVNNYYRTCGENTGWVVFTFTTQNNWSASQAEVAWLSDGYQNYTTEPITECGSDGGYGADGRIPCSHVTPEPITMVLLGSGMAGLGGAGLIRRRRKNGDVGNA